MQFERKLKCLLVDDEPLASEVVRNYMKAIPYMECVGECRNAIEALSRLSREKIDLILLDIQMPHLLGTELLRSIKNPPKVIFITAHPDFAVEGFELEAADYLLKPVAFNRFLKAVNRVWQNSGLGEDEMQEVSDLESKLSEPFLYFRSDRKMVKINLADIVYIESLRDYLKIVTTTKKVITKMSISSVENMLPSDGFLRVHRSFIISVAKIESFSNELVDMVGKEIPIGRFYRHEVIKKLKAFVRH